MKIRHTLLAVLGLVAWPATEAQAEFWTALDTVPKANAIIALDASVTMGIDMGACGGGGGHVCHRFDPLHPNTRLNRVKDDLLATLPSFQDYFAFGGFRYRGCGRARARGHVYPNNENLVESYDLTREMIENTLHCGFAERVYPDGSPPTAGCLTPACAREDEVLRDIAFRGIDGLNVTPPANYSGYVTCDVAGAPRPFINLQAMLLTQLGAGGFQWPSWGSTPDVAGVQADLCNPLQTELESIRDEIQACTTSPDSVWDMSFLSGTWCDASQITATVCTSGEPLEDTCVCQPNRASCRTGPPAISDCGNIYTWKARQQHAVCETYSPNRYGAFFQTHHTQQDNIVRGTGPQFCRENVALIMTDGAFGSTPGVVLEAYHAQPFYESRDRLSNMFVFHISTAFTDAADAMMNEVSAGLHPNAFSATDPVQMREAFAKVWNRIHEGVYTGASLTFDELGRRAYFHSFTVPGYDPGSPASHDYLGMPTRISVHRVREDGFIEDAPLYESDERARVQASPGGCGPVNVPPSLMSDIAIPPSTRHVDLIGPGGTFSNDVNRTVVLPAGSVDRNGDGAPDSHPPLMYGRSFGFAHSAPLIVDAPKDVPVGEGSSAAAVLGFMNATRTRPRVIYYQANGYVLGIHGGNYRPFGSPQTFGNRSYIYDYNDAVGYAGSEVFRYRPSWLTEPGVRYTYEFNNVVQQRLMTGQLVARELYFEPDYRTILLGNQGKEGRGYFAVDITNPCTPPSLVSEWTLPAGSYASGEPNVHRFPMPAAPLRRNVLIASSGLEADNNEIYAYDIQTGGLIARTALPARNGHSYPTAPVCVDATGEGVVTHCYVLRSDGLLVRVAVVPGRFEPYVNVTPQSGGSDVTRAPGRVFFTRPVAFFDVDGAVSLVFGSGNFKDLTQPSSANFVYKVRDENTRRPGVPNGPATVAQVCQPDGVGNTEGVFPLGPGERLISSPIVENGLVAWTTYVSRTTGCVSGDGYYYAMNFQTCADAQTGGARALRRGIGPGLPTAPTLHAQSERLLVNTSAGPAAGQVVRTTPQNTLGGGRPAAKRVFWRLESYSQ